MSEIEQRAEDIRARLAADFIKTLREHQGTHSFIAGPLLDDLVANAMRPIEGLLVQVGELQSRDTR